MRAEDLGGPAGATYPDPDDVLRDERLSLEDKRRILASWEYDLVERAVAAGEGMLGGEDVARLLQQVVRCRLRLEDGAG